MYSQVVFDPLFYPYKSSILFAVGSHGLSLLIQAKILYLDEYPVYRNMCPSVCRSLYAVLRLRAVETGWIWGRDYHICQDPRMDT
jgi:hypothetical protein